MDAGGGIAFGDINDTNKKASYTNKCVVIEEENSNIFENAMNDYLDEGYKVESSSCDDGCYKAILVLSER